MASLLYIDPLGVEHTVSIGDRPLIVGREAGCDVVLADPLISRRHCSIEVRGSVLQVTDLASRYGTWLDDERIEGTRVGTAGADEAVIRLGGTILRIVERAPGASGTASGAGTGVIARTNAVAETKELERALADAKRLALSLMAAVETGRDASELAGRMLDAISAAQSAAAALELDRGLSLVLVEVSKVTASANDVESVLRLTMDLALRALSGDRGFILLRGAEDELVMRTSRNMGNLRGISHSIADEVVRSGIPVRTTDAQVDPRFKEAASVMANIVRSVLCVPLRGPDGATIGAIYVDGMPGNPMFAEKGLEFLSAFSTHAAAAIEASTVPQFTIVGGRR